MIVRCEGCQRLQFWNKKGCKGCGQLLEKAAVEDLFPDPLPTLQEIKWLLLTEALRRCPSDKVAAAKMLGIGKVTLYRWQNEMKRNDKYRSLTE